MADSYQDFLDLAKSLNIDLSDGVSSIAPKLTDASPKTVMPEAAKEIAGNINNDTFLTPEAQEELDEFLGFLFPKTEAGKERAEQKSIERMSEMDAADYEARQKSMADMEEYLAGIAALENMGEADAADYLARQASLDKVKADSTAKGGGPDIVMKTPPTKEEKEAAQKRIEEASKEKDDDKPKGLKDYIRKAFEDPEAIVAFGRALVEGRGVSGGLEEYSKEREEGEKEQAALDAAAADLAFEKQKAEVDALYKAALSEQALAQAEKSQLGPNEIQIAQAMAMKAGNPAGTPEEMEAYNKAFFEALQTQITSKKDTGLDLDDTIKILALTGQLTPEKIKELFPVQGGGQTTGTVTDNVIDAPGVS